MRSSITRCASGQSLIDLRARSDRSESVDTCYYLLSAQPDAERFGQIARAHWAIENADARIGR